MPSCERAWYEPRPGRRAPISVRRLLSVPTTPALPCRPPPLAVLVAIAELANRLRIPVVTTFMGRGLLAGAEAPLAGTYLGIAGDRRLTELVEGSDGLLLLGVILCDTNFGVSAGKLDLRRTIQALDGQVTLGFHVYPDIPLPKLVAALLAHGEFVRAGKLGRALHFFIARAGFADPDVLRDRPIEKPCILENDGHRRSER